MTEEQKVEQITKEPEEKVEKIKDPKKVAAGKRLAASNKKARKEVMEANKQQDEESNSSGWFPSLDMNFSTVVGLVGIGLTATDLYFRYRKPTLVSTNVVEEKKKSPAVKEEQQMTTSKQIGME